MHVDPARSHDQAVNVLDCLPGFWLELAESGNPPVMQPHIGAAIDAKRWIDDAPAT
jgi:hypothetical protein